MDNARRKTGGTRLAYTTTRRWSGRLYAVRMIRQAAVPGVADNWHRNGQLRTTTSH